MALINETGVLAFKSEVETGTSKKGTEWSKMTIVVSVDNSKAPYDKVALSVMGAELNNVMDIKVGERVKFSYSVNANEYNGKWYNNVNLFRIEREAKVAPAPQMAKPVQTHTPEPLEPQTGDLPF